MRRTESGIVKEKAYTLASHHGKHILDLKGRHTEDEFLSGRQHVDCECHLILVNLQANPADHRIEDIEEGIHGKVEDVKVDIEASEVNNRAA